MNGTNQTVPSNTFFLRSYHYVPLADVAVGHTFLFAFASLSIIVSTLLCRHRPYYMWITIACAILETAGYGARIYSANNPELNSYVAQSLLILVVPIAMALVNYIVVGDLLKATGQRILVLTPARISRIFLASDVACFILQAGGSGMMTQASMKSTGEAMAIAGIILQLSFFTSFILLMLHMSHGRSFRLYDVPQLKSVFHCLYSTSALIYIRNVYRVVQFADIDGYVGTHEWMFDVFETFVIFLCFLCYSYWNFGRLLPEEAEVSKLIAARQDGSAEQGRVLEEQEPGLAGRSCGRVVAAP